MTLGIHTRIASHTLGCSASTKPFMSMDNPSSVWHSISLCCLIFYSRLHNSMVMYFLLFLAFVRLSLISFSSFFLSFFLAGIVCSFSFSSLFLSSYFAFSRSLSSLVSVCNCELLKFSLIHQYSFRINRKNVRSLFRCHGCFTYELVGRHTQSFDG